LAKDATTDPRTLLRLLLAFAPVGPVQRREARQALASRNEAAVVAVGGRIVRQLLQRGDLLAVANGPEGESGPQRYLLRGHTTLLDLTPLLNTDERRDAGPTTEPARRHGHGFLLATMAEQERLLSAMETAQRLPVTATHPEQWGDLLREFLDLLRPFFPDLEVVIGLLPNEVAGAAGGPVVVLPPAGEGPLWLRGRFPGESVLLDTPSELTEPVATRLLEPFEGRPPACIVAVPLYHPSAPRAAKEADREIGLLFVASHGPLGRDELLRLAMRLSRFVTFCWRQRLEVSMLVHTDSLTGLRNRGFFDMQFPLELERARRRQSPLVLLIGDIDHFKAINDRHGHQAGDRVLRSVARELHDAVRRIDMVSRVGGEEFALVLPDTGREAAMEIVTRLLVRIANLRQISPESDEPIRVTMSFGGVAFPEGGDSVAELYRRADEMLYISKQRGRNRCHFWNPEGDPLLTLPAYRAP